VFNFKLNRKQEQFAKIVTIQMTFIVRVSICADFSH
jgi:hypothetical protein